MAPPYARPNRRALLLACLASCSVLAAAQSTSTLDLPGALALAKQNNGTVRAATENLRSARAQLKGAYASYLPSLTGSYQRNQTQLSGNDNLNFNGTPGSTDWTPSQSALLTLNYTLFDNGRRGASYRQARYLTAQQEATSLQTLRQILFNVHASYFDALRAQELLKVQEAQQKRADEILQQTKVRVELKDAAKKDILQAQADALNARASYLQARNQVETSRNNLKAIIGWNGEAFPVLQPVAGEVPMEAKQLDKSQIVKEGLARRADLSASRAGIEASEQAITTARLNATAQLNTALSYQKSLGDNFVDTARLTLNVSGPLWDGGLTRSAVQQAVATRDAAKATYLQNSRQAQADIESTLYELQLNLDRYEVAKAALDAAQVNYNAASEAQKLGAGTLIDVLTAQLSLRTAEQNSVSALYDLLTSQVRLKLVTGQPLPGE